MSPSKLAPSDSIIVNNSPIGRVRIFPSPSTVTGSLASAPAAIIKRDGVPPAPRFTSAPCGGFPSTPCNTSFFEFHFTPTPIFENALANRFVSSHFSGFFKTVRPAPREPNIIALAVKLFEPGTRKLRCPNRFKTGTDSAVDPTLFLLMIAAHASRLKIATTSSIGTTNNRLSPSKSTGMLCFGLNSTLSYC